TPGLARRLCTRSSSQSRAMSMSSTPSRRWSTAWMPVPVTAHCLPIQKISRCKAMNGGFALTGGRQDNRPPDLRNQTFLRFSEQYASVARDHLQTAHVRLEHAGDGDRAVLLLIGLHHGDQRAAKRGAGAVQRVHESWLAVRTARAGVHAAGLEVTANRAARDLAERAALALPGHPDLDVIGFLRREAHVSGAQRHYAVMQIEPAQHFLGACQHPLVLVLAGLRRRDRHQLDLGELVLADHASRS